MQQLNDRVKDLIIRHLKEELTVQQQLELQAWVDLSEDNRAIFHRLNDPDKLNEDIKEYYEANANVWDKVDAGMKTASLIESTSRPTTRRIRTYIAAASLLFIIITGYFWLQSQLRSPSKARSASAPIASRDVAPGGNKATLTLANGSTIVLENAANGDLAVQGAAHVLKNKNALSYTVDAVGAAAPAIVYNTLTTPRAGEFQLVLPDGTKAWLNNASSLRYPTSFAGSSREVELTGEAYFEVAKNTAQPFSVRLHDAVVHVLGTSFNIMAYSDEPVFKTTLLTGKVSVATADAKSFLSPGEQGVISHIGTINVLKDIDTEEVIAWQRGFFHFVHANIGDVLRQLARWYDVEVEYRMPVPDDYTFDGEIGRNLSLAVILKHLEKKDVHFTIEGKKLIVSK